MRGILDSKLPKAAPTTIYGRIGDWALTVLVALMLTLAYFLQLDHSAWHKAAKPNG
jgi:apolipoprotein N-acyltransferase